MLNKLDLAGLARNCCSAWEISGTNQFHSDDTIQDLQLDCFAGMQTLDYCSPGTFRVKNMERNVIPHPVLRVEQCCLLSNLFI